jgi:ribosomal protein S18 acetylase RimI-like enzyme
MTNQGDRQSVCARPVKPQEAESCGVLLGLCFEEEAWSAAMLEVLDEPASRRRFLRESSINELEAYLDRASVYVVDAWELPVTTQGVQPGAHATDAQKVAAWDTRRTLDPAFDGLPAGVVLFDATNAFTPVDHEALWEHSLRCGCEVLSTAEAQLLRQRVRLLESFDHNNWSTQAFPNGYGYISAVCVNPRYRGRGVLDALFAPAIAHAQEAGVPLCLETFAERSRDIYIHKGFKVIETFTNNSLPLTQYCLARDS